MEMLKEFTIPFIGLKDGKHHFKFLIDDKFFAHFEFNDFDQAILKSQLTLDKKPSFLELHFHVIGPITLTCDVSTELFDYKIESEFDLIVKFGIPLSNTTDEILVLSEGSYEINVAHYFYEMIVLALPQKRIHPGIQDGSLKSGIVEKLKTLQPKETPLKGSEDPRWNKLKDLL